MIKTYFLFLIWSITWQSRHRSLDGLFNHTPTTRWRNVGRWRPTLIKNIDWYELCCIDKRLLGLGFGANFGGLLSHCFPLTRDPRNPYCFGVDELGRTENKIHRLQLLGSKKIITKLTEKVQIRGLSFLVLICGSFSFRFFLRDLRHA